tara:strand:+ start:1747 stop:2184 length:438 start_codon:yes stop_codon:yes gene_type:complete
MDLDHVKWFSRSEGSWVSHRRYLYGPKRQVDNLVTNFNIKRTGEKQFQLTWDSDRNEGEMNFWLEGNLLKRDSGYYTSQPTNSIMHQIDEDTIVFQTSYGGVDYREEIRYLNGDKARLRQTVGTEGDKIKIVGQYYEERSFSNDS